jgi:hypothetical protein
MKLSYKAHDTESIVMPDDFCYKEKDFENPLSFEKVTEEFEKQHCKIINRGIFIKQLQNDNVVMKSSDIRTSYCHLIYKKVKRIGYTTTYIDINFINNWLNNNPTQRVYDDIGVYPNAELCPTNHFNMWRPFEMEYINEYQTKQTELDFILNHIKVLCNHDDVVFDYFIKWIAQMIQHPETKTNCPTFISKEGAGKGTLMRLFKNAWNI